MHNPRDSPHPGGGTGILYKSSLTIFNISYYLFSHSEALICAISSPFSRTFNISLFYCPTSPNINLILYEFSLFLPTITSNIIILGDFNIPNPPMIQSVNTFLTSFDLVQHVTSPTHVHGNTLDHIFSPKLIKLSLTLPTEHSSPTTFSYSLSIVTPKPPDPSLPESHVNSIASPFLLLSAIFLPFQPQRLQNSILLSHPPSINTPLIH